MLVDASSPAFPASPGGASVVGRKSWHKDSGSIRSRDDDESLRLWNLELLAEISDDEDEDEEDDGHSWPPPPTSNTVEPPKQQPYVEALLSEVGSKGLADSFVLWRHSLIHDV